MMFPVNHPWKTVFLSFLVVAFIASFMRFVAPSVSYKDMLGADHQKLIDYETIQNEYTNDDNLLVLIQDVSGNPFNVKTLSAIEELTEVLWQTPYSIRVDSITNFQHSEAEGDELKVADLVEQAADKDADAVREVREIALAEPLLLNRAVNLAGNVLAINVSFAFPNQSAQEKLDAVGFVYQQLDNLLGQRPDLIGHVSGLVALDATVMQVSQKETGLFLGLVLLSVILLMSLLLRSWKPIAVSVVIFIFSIISGVAFSGMMGWKLTPFTASVPMVILIIAVADCTHLITSFLFAMRSGADKFSAVASALQKNFKPIAITSITTALGFLTLNLSASQGINALGNQVAFGVMMAFFLSVTLLPAALVLLPFKSGSKPSSLSLEKYSGRFVDGLYRFRFGVLLTTAIVVGTLGWTATLNEFNDNIPTYFSKSLPWRQANDFAEEQFGGAYTFSYSIQVNDSVAVSDPDFLAGVEMFVEWLRQQPEVVYVNSVTDTMKKLNRNMHSEDTAFYRLPKNKELAAQYLLLYEMSLPFGLDLNNQVNLDKTATRVLVTFKTLSTKEVLAMEKRISNWLEQNLQQGAFLGSGVQLMFAYLLDHDTRALIFGTVGGLLVISLMLIVALRSWKVGLISVAPNLFPVVLAFGVWGLLVGQVGMGMAMVSGMTIGIIVDDTVHFLNRYLIARRDNRSPRDAVVDTFKSVVPAIVFTTVVLIVGFSLMSMVAEFRVNSDMGKMTSLILLIALLFDLLVLPVLLMMFDRQKSLPNPRLA